MAKPLVFNIQKFSPHDGDGIRTTIFFKGCPLSCLWCHNPESQRFQRELVYYRSKCISCGRCIPACPAHCITFDAPENPEAEKMPGKLVFDRSRCTACGVCEEVCLKEARQAAGKEYTVKELIKEAKKDLIFYERSGGGVTLSGGEVMAQDMDYITALCRGLQDEGISVFIDTSGCVPYERYEKILPFTDVFLYDIKLMDPEKHKKYIGADNTQILRNLIRLSRDKAKIYLRIPVVGGINADDGFFESVIRFLHENQVNISRVNLLPYHDIAKGKYQNLGRVYEEEKMQVPSDIQMQHFKQMFEAAGYADVGIGG